MSSYEAEIDGEVTEKLISEGYWTAGTLLQLDGHLFMVMGYNFWGWLQDCEDPTVFYDVILYHIGTGFKSSFPLKKVLDGATEF